MSYNIDINQNQKYPNLLQNGKLFPSWIVHNFKKYKIPKISDIEKDIDGCIQQNKDEKRNLRNYQIFLSKFMDYNSPFNSILLYHGMGSGKTATAINVYNNLYKYNPNWNVIILLPASLIKSTWAGTNDNGELKRWLTEDNYEHKRNNIKFVSYNSPIADKKYDDTLKECDMNKNNLFIIDEAHNFFNNVYNNLQSETAQKAKHIYDDILQRKREDPRTRIILITGTPIVNKIYELALIYNLLRPGIFDISENEFNKLFIDENTQEIQYNHLNTFQRRILGLTSFYDNPDPSIFASKTIYNIDIELPKYQKIINKHFTEEERTSNKYNYENENYMAFSRMSCNFAFPTKNGISGDKRPKLTDFNLTDNELNELINKGEKNIDKNKFREVGFEKAKKNYINAFKNYLDDLKDDDKNNNIQNDIDYLLKNIKSIDKTNEVLKEYVLNNNKCSSLLKSLYDCSAKYCVICLSILQSPGPVIIYSNYVSMEGFEIMKIYLEQFGFIDNADKKANSDKYDFKRFVEFTGEQSQEERSKNVELESNKENIYGKDIKIVLISGAGTEGISLNHIRQTHITEPYWNENRIDQVMARGVRFCSHKYLKMEERHVDIFRYKSVCNEYKTADVLIQEIANKKKKITQSFLNAIKSSAVDCELNKEANNRFLQDKDKIKCFNFNENELLNSQITQAYKLNILDDVLIDNGMNSSNSITKDEELIEIECYIEQNKNKLSKETKKYWLNKNTGIVYDHKDLYIIGSIKQINNSFVNIDNKFIIDKLVFYPEIKNS